MKELLRQSSFYFFLLTAEGFLGGLVLLLGATATNEPFYFMCSIGVFIFAGIQWWITVSGIPTTFPIGYCVFLAVSLLAFFLFIVVGFFVFWPDAYPVLLDFFLPGA